MNATIPSAVEWLQTQTAVERPWLLLGKGPSFDQHTRHDLERYRTLALNHACLPVEVDAAHFIDWEALQQCLPELLDRRTVVLCAWRLHQHCKPGQLNLFEHCRRDPRLRSLRAQARLYTYHATTARDEQPQLPRITVKYFSAEAGLALLVKAGAKEVLTLGIDGGSRYSPQFNPKDRLANGRKSFDIQFAEMNALCKRQGVTYRPLTDHDL